MLHGFVQNNNGYTVERFVHGKTAPYNGVAIDDYSLLAKVFRSEFQPKYYGPIKTCGTLTNLLNTPGFGDAGCLEVRRRLEDP